jgi:hypothetical protein
MRLSTVKSTKMTPTSTDMYCSLNIFISKCHTTDSYLNMNGVLLGFNNLEAGYILKFMHQNLLFFCLDVL